jgi:hypothetical protein
MSRLAWLTRAALVMRPTPAQLTPSRLDDIIALQCYTVVSDDSADFPGYLWPYLQILGTKPSLKRLHAASPWGDRLAAKPITKRLLITMRVQPHKG